MIKIGRQTAKRKTQERNGLGYSQKVKQLDL